MKTSKTILVASSSLLTAGMAQGAIVYHYVNTNTIPGGSEIDFDLNTDSTTDFKAFFDGSGSSKPCLQSLSTSAVPTPWVFNQVIMNPSNNGMPVIPYGTPITDQFTVGANTVAPGTDSEGNHRGYFVQNGSTSVVGEWPANQDTYGYCALALVDATTSPATTNFGWVQIELDYSHPTPRLRVIDYAYQTSPTTVDTLFAGQLPPSPPTINESPTNQTTVAGSTVSLHVAASGNPAPGFRWMSGGVSSGTYTNVPNGGNLSGADTDTLTIANVTPANQLDYIAIATNISGAATSSPPATLAVLPAGVTGPVPDKQVIYAGYPAQFTVTDLGGGFTNQWQRNGANLSNGAAYSGVNSSNIVISSVDPTNVGNYQAIVTTAYGSATSSVAPLSLVSPDGSLYESVVRAYGAVNYYRLNETSGTNAWDFIGGRNGIYNSPTASLGNPGPSPGAGFPGFATTNYAAAFQADFNVDTNAYIKLLPWNLNTNTVTLTAWIYPAAQEGAPGVNNGIVYTVGAGDMIFGLRYDGTYGNTNGINDANIGYNWNNDGSGLWNSQISAPHNKWSLVALAMSPNDATLYIINDTGVQSAVDTRSHAPQPFDATEYIGTYPLEGPLGVNNFIGYIDEVALFKSTLSSNQVSNLYKSALGIAPPMATISITNSGGNIQIIWTGANLLQASSLTGPWTIVSTASLPYIVSPTNAQGYFRAQQ